MFTRILCPVILLALVPVISAAQTATHPTVSYSTYLTGNDHTEITASATDANGYQYVAGITAATDFPTTSGAYRRTPSKITTCEFFGAPHCEYQTMFIAKLNPGGTSLVYSTYIGAGYPHSIAVDSAGNAYVVVQDADVTKDRDIPTTSGAWHTSCTSTSDSCYLLMKLNATGSALVYSTFLVASNCQESFNGVALDSTDRAFVVGTGGPGCFMTSGAFRTTTQSYMDAVVMKFNVAGSGVLYSTYVGGSNSSEQDHGNAIAVDSNDHAIITGDTSFNSFPTSKSAFQRVFKGEEDAFVTKLSADGSTLLASTLLGGSTTAVQGISGTTYGSSVAVDPLNDVYVTGNTTATDFPVTPGAPEPVQDPGACDVGGNIEPPCGDAFLTKLPMSFSAPVYSTFLGGPNGQEGNAYVTVDAVGHAFVDGSSESAEVPLVKPTSSSGETWLAELNTAGTAFLFSTRYGNDNTIPAGIGIDAAGNAYAGGLIVGSGLSTTPNAYQTVNTSADGFAGWAARWDIPPCTLSSADRTVTICTASNGSTVPQKWLLSAGATDSVEIDAMKVYVDGKSVFSIQAPYFNAYIDLAPGPHQITVKAWDSSGPFAKSIDVTAE